LPLCDKKKGGGFLHLRRKEKNKIKNNEIDRRRLGAGGEIKTSVPAYKKSVL